MSYGRKSQNAIKHGTNIPLNFGPRDENFHGNCRADTNIRNVTKDTFSKRTNIRIFVHLDD